MVRVVTRKIKRMSINVDLFEQHDCLNEKTHGLKKRFLSTRCTVDARIGFHQQ